MCFIKFNSEENENKLKLNFKNLWPNVFFLSSISKKMKKKS